MRKFPSVRFDSVNIYVSFGKKTLLAIDSVCCALYEIEVLQMKLMSCRDLFATEVS